MLKQRVITAVILFALFLGALFALPEIGWQALIAVVVWQGAVEWARLSKLTSRNATLYCAATVLVMAGMMWLGTRLTSSQQDLLHMLWYVAAIIFWVLVVPAWMIASWRPQHRAGLALVGWLVLIPTGLAMLDLRAYSPWMLLFAMTVVMVADTAAYFSGRRFGKSKLAPAISPGKTWEGVFGALIVVALYITLVGVSNGWFSNFMLFPTAMVAGSAWVGLAVMGDLFESAIKRQAGVKDSGAILPGHGGVLDRIDALTSTLPFAAFALILQRMG